MTDLINIGGRIKELRKSKGWKQADFAEKMGVTRTVVGKWETGIQDFKTEHIIKMADVFGVTCDYLLRGVKAENVDVNKDLGLSDKAVSILKEIKETDKDNLLDMINKLLSNDLFMEMISSLVSISELAKSIEEAKNNIHELEFFDINISLQSLILEIKNAVNVKYGSGTGAENIPTDLAKKLVKINDFVKKLDIERYECETRLRDIINLLTERRFLAQKLGNCYYFYYYD